MARATKIYVVEAPNTSISGAFTVKHEMISWLERHSIDETSLVWSVSDGAHQDVGGRKLLGTVEEIRDGS